MGFGFWNCWFLRVQGFGVVGLGSLGFWFGAVGFEGLGFWSCGFRGFRVLELWVLRVLRV